MSNTIIESLAITTIMTVAWSSRPAVPMRRALRIRDSGCRFPGCTNTRFVDGHHMERLQGR